MKFITNTNAIILHLDNKPTRIEKSDARYAKIVKCFDLPDDEQEDAVRVIINPVAAKLDSIHGKDGFEVVGDLVYYKGSVLPTALITKVKSIIRDGLPLEHFEKFWINLDKNPSASSVSELVQFLEYKELPITEDGCFLAYKGVNSDYWSKSGNTNTKVLKGTVDSAGRIYNGIGELLEVSRRDVDDNRDNHCSFGLHVGSLKYASDFGSGGRVVIVKVNPKDVVSVPTDYDCQKCRVTSYEVVSDFECEILSSVVDEDGEETIVPNSTKERNEFIDKIDNYLFKKANSGVDEVTVRQIQNTFSPDYPSRVRVLDAVQSLGYGFYTDEDGIVNIYTN